MSFVQNMPPPHLLVVVVCRVIESLYVCMNMYMYMYKLIRYVRSWKKKLNRSHFT